MLARSLVAGEQRSSSAVSAGSPQTRASTSATSPPRECVTQVQPRALGQRLRERERVGDRARAERRMVERVDAVAVVLEQRSTRCGCCVHSLPKVPWVSEKVPCTNTSSGPPSGAARHLREQRAAALELRQRLGLERVDAGIDLRVDALDDLPTRRSPRPGP